MKFASFTYDGASRWGLVDGDAIYDLTSAFGESGRTLRDAIAADLLHKAEAAASKAPRAALSQIVLQPVIPNPDKILCIGLNYDAHRVESGFEPSGYPTIFTRFSDTQLGHGADIIRPSVSTHFDYEGELAVVIGKSGRHITRAQAMAHVAGYACYNDVSVRDWQIHTTQFLPGKNFPATGPFGPHLVPAWEIEDYQTLKLETRLNGAVVQSAGLDQLIFPIPHLIAYCSTFTQLNPGDVIVTGTPSGVGFKRSPPLFMKAGDTIEVEISKVGLLRNRIVDESPEL